jgi:hypothetical protein
MTIPDWATTISGVLALFAAVWAVHRFTTRAMIRDYLSELKPNHGSSIKDKVNNIDTKVAKMENRIDQLYILMVSDRRNLSDAKN